MFRVVCHNLSNIGTIATHGHISGSLIRVPLSYWLYHSSLGPYSRQYRVCPRLPFHRDSLSLGYVVYLAPSLFWVLVMTITSILTASTAAVLSQLLGILPSATLVNVSSEYHLRWPRYADLNWP